MSDICDVKIVNHSPFGLQSYFIYGPQTKMDGLHLKKKKKIDVDRER